MLTNHCAGGPFIPYVTMRNGPIDIGLLRKSNNELETISIQMKSFAGTDWNNIPINVGHVIQEALIKTDLLLLLNEHGGYMELFFIAWDYFKNELENTGSTEDGEMFGFELIDDFDIHSTEEISEETVVSTMTFTKRDNIQDNGHAPERVINNNNLRVHLESYFRPLSFDEQLIVEAGKYLD